MEFYSSWWIVILDRTIFQLPGGVLCGEVGDYRAAPLRTTKGGEKNECLIFKFQQPNNAALFIPVEGFIMVYLLDDLLPWFIY